MKILSRILFIALIALCWTGTAVANADETGPAVDASALRAATNIQLDLAFESFVSQDGGASLNGLAGPSSMVCSRAAMSGGTETCVVTTDQIRTTSPAALAHR